MDKRRTLRVLKDNRAALAQRGVGTIAIFGSVARDEAGPHSDIDLLVELAKPMGLFEFIRLRTFLEGLLQCRVDLVTPQALDVRIRDEVLKEAVRAA